MTEEQKARLPEPRRYFMRWGNGEEMEVTLTSSKFFQPAFVYAVVGFHGELIAVYSDRGAAEALASECKEYEVKEMQLR